MTVNYYKYELTLPVIEYHQVVAKVLGITVSLGLTPGGRCTTVAVARTLVCQVILVVMKQLISLERWKIEGLQNPPNNLGQKRGDPSFKKH